MQWVIAAVYRRDMITTYSYRAEKQLDFPNIVEIVDIMF